MLGRNLPIVMDFLVVLRHVNAELLGLVLAEEGVTRDQADILAARLARYSIMTTSEDADAESFRLHERIRRHRLAEMPPDTVRRRHERAEHVYAEKVADFEPEWDPDADNAFTVWARFESPEFQALLREWLFHAVRSQSRHLSQQTGVRITQIFLEAFWWWGFYVRSPVCEQLLREFDLISADKSDADRQWLGDLSTFYRNFRWGYVYNVPGPRDWAEVGPAMLGLRRRAGLNQGKTMDKGRYAIDVITESTELRQLRSGIRAAIRRRRPGFSPTRVPLCGAASPRATSHISGGTLGSSTSLPTCGPDAADRTRRARGCASWTCWPTPPTQDLFDRDLISRTASLQGEVYWPRRSRPGHRLLRAGRPAGLRLPRLAGNG